MKRTDLIDKLQTVAPALGNSDLIPMLAHVWFMGEELIAFNDQISISAPLKTEFTGAVMGTVLLNMLKASRAKVVELQPTEDEMSVKAASMRLKLAMLPIDDAIFEMPEKVGVKEQLVVDMPKFLKGVRLCMRSVGTDVSVPDQLGVTLIQQDGVLDMFATNNSTVTKVPISFKGSVPFSDQIILPTLFCQQMLRIAGDGKKTVLEISDDYALFCAGSIRLFGRLLESENPVKFQKVIDQHMPKASRKKMVEIPSKMALVLERAIIISDTAIDGQYVTIEVRDGRMKFFSKSELGHVTDTVQIGEQHPDVKVNVDAKILKSGQDAFDRMLVTDKCTVLEKDGAVHLVASVG